MTTKSTFLLVLLCILTFKLKSQITISVGTTGDYSTINAAYTSCTDASAYIIEIKSDYIQEALPIILGTLVNKNSTNNITIRPELGVTNLSFLNTGTENDVFVLSSANYLTIDGRPGGVGSNDFSIENNQTAKGHALKIEGSCTEINLNYLSFKGSNQSPDLGPLSTDAGVILIGESGSGIISDININYCEIGKSSGGIPTYLVSSYSASGSVTNCSLKNSALSDASRKYIQLYTNTSDWEISSNHFYQTTTFTPPSGFTFAFVRLYEGSGYLIEGNYFGGQGKNCGGSAFTIGNANAKAHLISISSSVTGTTNIYNNTFQNINFTTINTSSPSFSIVNIAGGNGIYNIGDNENGNTIGKTVESSSIIINDNGGTATASTCLFYTANTTETNINYNSIGAINLLGSNTSGNYLTFYSSSSGSLNFNYNIVGNTNSNNISDDIARTGPIYMGGRHRSSGTLTANNNTIQNFNLSENSTGFLYFIETTTASSVNASNNNIKNITSERNAFTDLFALSITGNITTNNNVIETITLNGSDSQVYFFDLTSSGGNINCSENTIGGESSNNIICNGNNASTGIILSIPSTKTATLENNTLQNIYLSNSSAANQFYGIYTSGLGKVEITGVEIKHILSESIYPTTAIYGIYQYNSGSNNLISDVRLNDFRINTIDATSTRNIGIYLRADNTNGIVEKIRITNFSNEATNAPTDYGIYSLGVASSWTIKNNVIIMDNESILNSLKLIGLRNSATGDANVYHNTIKISGAVSAGTDYSVCYLDDATAGVSRIAKNNIFYNNRSGGTGTHYGIWNINDSGMQTDYNYEEATTNVWANVAYTNFSDFTTNSGASNDVSSTITIDALGGVSSGSTGTIENAGFDLFTGGLVTDDLDGNSRDIFPWIGAFETVQPLPIQITFLKGENEYNYNRINWAFITNHEVVKFKLEKTTDGQLFYEVYKSTCTPTPFELNKYEAFDFNYENIINYYRLSIESESSLLYKSPLISIDNRTNNKTSKNLVYIINQSGQEINESQQGLKIYYYDDGSFEKKYETNL
jgi:hypothetical protein